MRRMKAAVMVVAALCAAPAGAQDLSDEALLEMFETQRRAYQEAQESGTGRTRGLTLVTVEDTGTVPAAEESATVTTTTETPQAGGQQPLQPLPVMHVQMAQEMQVNVRIAFAFDSAVLSNDQKPKLDQLCRVMKGSDIARFRIVGHTDASGSEAYNEKLSVLRAEEVKRYLVTECGLSPDRLEAVGMGERFLFDEAHPRADENRRVEFQALS